MGGLDDEAIAKSRELQASNSKADAALKFAAAVLRGKGSVSDGDFAHARSAGLTDGEVAEVIAHVALNVLTNYFNKAAETAIDFPKVEAARRGA